MDSTATPPVDTVNITVKAGEGGEVYVGESYLGYAEQADVYINSFFCIGAKAKKGFRFVGWEGHSSWGPVWRS